MHEQQIYRQRNLKKIKIGEMSSIVSLGLNSLARKSMS